MNKVVFHFQCCRLCVEWKKALTMLMKTAELTACGLLHCSIQSLNVHISELIHRSIYLNKDDGLMGQMEPSTDINLYSIWRVAQGEGIKAGVAKTWPVFSAQSPIIWPPVLMLGIKLTHTPHAAFAGLALYGPRYVPYGTHSRTYVAHGTHMGECNIETRSPPHAGFSACGTCSG